MKKSIFTICFLACVSFFGLAESQTVYELAGNLKAYPYVDNEPPAQTPPPEGYKPFHMEHYGRHGSRWLIGDNDYLTPVRNLEKAEKAGKLTPQGKKTLELLKKIQKASEGRLGELSDNGALQHRAIGRRMARNYPEIFNGNSKVDAKATVVIRCILSMANSLEGIKEVSPEVQPTMDASYADMWFMNFDDQPAWKVKGAVEKNEFEAYKKERPWNDAYLDRLVTDPQFARDSVAPGIMPYLYWVLANTQSHSDQPWVLDEVFTKEELKPMWREGNAYWFMHGGNFKLTNGRMPFVQRNLLQKIIEGADSAISTGTPGANLRYGHDSILGTIVTLMEVGGYGEEVASFEDLEKTGWHDYDIIPMAGNLQLIFYAKDGNLNPDDVLVKAMLNEREVSLPGLPVNAPYYRWSDVRNYYLDKLNKFNEGIEK